VNLHGLEVDAIERGDVLARPGTLFPSLVWEVELACLASSPKPIKHRKEAHFHHGAREVMARVFLLDREALNPGETAVCQVRFTEPLAGVFGDRVVLRSFSPLRTIAGGRVVCPLGRKVRRFSEDVARLFALAAGRPEEVVAAQLARAGAEGLDFARLVVLSDLEAKALEKLLLDLCGKQQAFLVERDARVYVSGEAVRTLCDGLLAHVAAFHRREPMKPGLSRGELVSGFGKGLSPKLFHFLLERLLKQGALVAEQEVLRLPGHKVSLASDQAKLREAVLSAFERGGITPPNVKDVLEPLGVSFKEAAAVFKVLQDEGRLIKVKEEMYIAAGAMRQLTVLVSEYLAKHGEMVPADFREVSGLSRKYLIPFLEWMDKEKITVRVGDKRRLRKRE
jgi:selenocysteine-specific elongation factor